MTEKLNPNANPQTEIPDEELDNVTGGFLATMDANGKFVRVSEVPMPKSDERSESISELMRKNIKNASTTDPHPFHDKENWGNFIKK